MGNGWCFLNPLRNKGIQAYRIGPLLEAREVGGFHGDDERILESAFVVFNFGRVHGRNEYFRLDLRNGTGSNPGMQPARPPKAQ